MRQLRSWHRVHVDFRVGRNSVHCRSLFAAKVTCMPWCFEDKDLFLWKFFCRLPSEVLRNGERRLITVFESSYLSGVFVIRRVQTCHFTPDPSCNMDFELFPKTNAFPPFHHQRVDEVCTLNRHPKKTFLFFRKIVCC